MADAQPSRIGLISGGDGIEVWCASLASELEHSCGVVDHVDVDIASLQGIDSSASVHGVFVLIHLDDVVESVRPIPVAAHVIKIQPICLPAFACDHSYPLHTAA